VKGWFSRLQLPVIVLRGYGSQTYFDAIARMVRRDPRPTTLVYAGDFDPSGEDIERDFRARVPGIQEIVKVAVTPDTVRDYDLPENPGKESDPRAAGFVERHGRLVQVEVEALAPDDLRDLFRAVVDLLVDLSTLDAVLARERVERSSLTSSWRTVWGL
jgi:hypothetical protein